MVRYRGYVATRNDTASIPGRAASPYWQGKARRVPAKPTPKLAGFYHTDHTAEHKGYKKKALSELTAWQVISEKSFVLPAIFVVEVEPLTAQYTKTLEYVCADSINVSQRGAHYGPTPHSWAM
ncbi:hypothetical protein Btru_076823 [Bulinus truncatus]|nr:hypothetical protein Btru_076823 [Bulinus truncatus]